MQAEPASRVGLIQALAAQDKRHTMCYARPVKPIVWSAEKNAILKAERGISFEDVVFHIQAGDVVETFDHPNQERYPGQYVHAVEIEEYVYLVPFVETQDEVFLKTIIPSRKATKRYQSKDDE